MNMQVAQTNTCLIHSVAMCIDVPAEDLIRELGHDGIPEGLHIQEIMDVLASRGYGLVPFESDPVLGSYHDALLEKHVIPAADRSIRMRSHMRGRAGIIITRNTRTGHACAWDGVRVYDPRGRVYAPSWDKVEEFWALVQF